MRVLSRWCWLLLLAYCQLRLHAGEVVTIHLRPTSEVAAPRATLGEVADLSGDDAALIARMRALVVQELPDAAPRTLDPQVIRMAIGRAVPGIPLIVRGHCRLTRAVEVVSGERLAAAAQAHAVTALEGRGAVRSEVARSSGPLSVPSEAGSPPDVVAEPLTAPAPGETAYRVRVLRHGRELARALVVLRVRLFATVPVAARALARGSVIGAGDVRMAPVEAGVGEAPAPELAAVVGAITTRDIAEGAPLAGRLLQAAPAVRGGTTVTLIVHGPGLTLTAVATALGDGAIGERIQVRRGTDGKNVAARVEAPGQVVAER